MAAVFDPQTMPSHPVFTQHAVPQVAISCVGLLCDASSNRTFRIPDVPATSTVAHIKQWYAKNVSEGTDPRSLVVIHNAQPIEDTAQVWQLAQGQGQFAVTVAQAKSPRSMLSLYVDTGLPTPLPLCISSDSSVLYVKQRLFEMLNLPMVLASALQTTLIMPPSSAPLQNDVTLEGCGMPNNARLSLAFQQDSSMPDANIHQPPQQAVNPFGTQPQYARIKEIWNEPSSNSSASQYTPMPSQAAPKATHSLLPSQLFEEDDEEVSMLCQFVEGPHIRNAAPSFQSRSPGHTPHTPPPTIITPTNNSNGGSKGRGGRRQRSRSHSPSELSQEQLQHLAANFRTKTCRNGPSCKFGRNCWFAHTAEELRKPSDPLPNNLPAVHKLERYSHREASAKDRHNA